MQELLALYPSGRMIAAAPDGTLPRRIGDKKFKNSLPAVPRRSPEAEVLGRDYDFHGSGVNRIDSYLFLLCHIFHSFFLVIHHLVPPPFFMRKIFRMKLQTDRENSNYLLRFGNTALSQLGGCLSGGSEAPRNVFKLKIKEIL